MKKYIKDGLKFLIIYIILISIFIGSVTLVSLIPSEWMKKNVQETAEIMYGQENIWKVPVFGVLILFDNFTDALMINTAYSIDNNHPFTSAMLARKNYIPGVTKDEYKDMAGELKSSSKYPALNQIGELMDIAHGEADEAFEYARYWHGYLVWLRPFLCFMNISNIRLLFTLIFIGLGAALTIIVAKKIDLIYGVVIRYSGFSWWIICILD